MAPGKNFQLPLCLVQLLRCDNEVCKSKSKRVTVRHSHQCANGFDLKFRRGPTSVCEGAPKVFRQRNSQRFTMEISKAKNAAAAPAARSASKSGTATDNGNALAPASDEQELRGAEILIKAFQAEGVKYIWGYPGGAVLHIYDALYKQDTIQHILVRHEQAAVHAADGYARATGDVGVALVTSGPGVTNAVTGIATAYMDSIPLVIVSGQVPTGAIGMDAFQECDAVGITRPVVKHNFLVKDARDLA